MLLQTYMIFFYLWYSKVEALKNVRAALFHTMEANRDKLEKSSLGFFQNISKRLNNDGRIWIIAWDTIETHLHSNSHTHLVNTNTPAPQVTVLSWTWTSIFENRV